MRNGRIVSAGFVGICLLLLVAGPAPEAQEPATKAGQPGTSRRASGTFEVKVTPVADTQDSLAAGRLNIAKTFHGDLEGTSRGEMWTAETSVEGSAGYVAIEKVEGTLRGRKGAFTLLHQGTMRQGGDYQLAVVIVPDSGTADLAGLAGSMTIVIADGKHSYALDYTLPDAR